MIPAEVLDLPLEDGAAADSKAETIRGYLIALLDRLWEDDECFSPKRPFGNSGWQWDIYLVLIKHGAISGTLDEDGYIDDCDDKAGAQLIRDAIQALGATA